MARIVESVADYIDALGRDAAPRGHSQLFRGHDQDGIEPEPKVFRGNNLRNEHRSLREFVSAFPQEFDRDATTLEKMVRAQHFGIPTRLLDLTWNPLIALYFACQSQPNRNGEVISYTIPKYRINYYDSDTVSILSNICYLTVKQKENLLNAADDIILSDDDEIDAFNADSPARYLLHYIKGEKPHFENKIDPDHLTGMFFVKPKLNNRRILAQSGAFAIYGLRLPSENQRKRYGMRRYEIPSSSKKDIINTLALLNIHNSSVFPEVENAASYIQSRL